MLYNFTKNKYIKGGFYIKKYGDEYLKGNSRNWKNWQCKFTLTTCTPCKEKHGTIYPPESHVEKLHPNGKCTLVPMRTKTTGNVTKKGIAGADVYLKYTGVLPSEYLTKNQARKKGWEQEQGNLAEVLPGKTIGDDVYKNKNSKLPDANGRIWYEADFDYYKGYRNDCRLLYSSDGLIFVTTDHYETFYELI